MCQTQYVVRTTYVVTLIIIHAAHYYCAVYLCFLDFTAPGWQYANCPLKQSI